MYTKLSYFKRKLRGLSIKLFNYIENNGNCNFDSNGEKYFVNNLLKDLSIKKSLIIFDIGANVGEYAHIIIQSSRKFNVDVNLYLFEPVKSCFEKLSQDFSVNESVNLNNFGASDSNGTAMIYYDKESSGFSSLYKRNMSSYGFELDQSEEIRLMRMDDYIVENKIQHIDFIKIDIEGHELKAFQGFGKYLSSKFIDYIQFEYGGANLDSHTSLMEIYSFLEDRGFYVAKILNNGIEVREYKPYMDNFNYSNYVAISKEIFQK
ncbi:FkbM family methyltransferase [Methylophaga sp. UBA2689]|uniref:FkbM family methyltransferase n=1 Tax=Methylophaga sp. UBA2689 TaxID=1946878 RepID=UPI0025D03936|nr:FkbM family methyltransferase [Methylophaga sp. UBA2689]|tara:strand:- start:11699 stop:12487 length:789 start_codon:yes stop_codon:yes gene_type:complete